MSTIPNLFQQAQLAEAAYANLSGMSIRTSLDALALALTTGDAKFSITQATDFVTHWRVVSQFSDDSYIVLTGDTGFSATLFESLDHPGQFTFAVRGTDSLTELLVGADLSLMTGGVAIDEVIAMVNYVLRLQAGSNGETRQVALSFDAGGPVLTTGFVAGEGPGIDPAQLTVTGHSLGGFLAQIYQRIFGSAGVYTYNALGVIRTDAEIFDQFTALLGLTAGRFGSGLGDNVVVAGEPAQFVGNVQGNPQRDTFSEGADQGPIDAHSIKSLTDALAVYNLFTRIDPALDTLAAGYENITGILKASRDIAGNSLESAVRALGGLFGVRDTDFTSNEFDVDRDLLYKAVNDIKAAVPASNGTERQLRSLVGATQADLIEGANALEAYRYALKHLNPFVVTGFDYGQHNAQGELDLYDPQQRTGALTEAWIADSAAFLAWKNLAYTQDASVVSGQADQYFEHLAERVRVQTSTSSDENGRVQPPANPRRFIFGGDNAEYLAGEAQNDKLYGAGGSDWLVGGEGNDYLEGGTGLDIYQYGALQASVPNEDGSVPESAVNDGEDIVLDADGKGVLRYRYSDNGELASTVIADASIKLSESQWQSADGKFTYTKSGTEWVVSVNDGKGSQITLKDFQKGDFYIRFGDERTSPVPQRLITGDTEDWDASEETDGIQPELDAFGNTKRADGQDGRNYIAKPDREDSFRDSPQDDFIFGHGGNDVISAVNGGRDWILGGAGRDWVYAGGGGDIVEGGDDSDDQSGGDIISGDEGDDELYGQNKIALDEAINPLGAAASASGRKGDWLNGGMGDDYVVGFNGNDVLMGGLGSDMLVGGSGNDVLDGDDDYTAASFNWYWTFGTNPFDAVFIPIQNNNTVPLSGSADVLYGGAGIDILYGQFGDDLLYGGEDGDFMAGGSDNDVLIGGEGDDAMTGDANALVFNDAGVVKQGDDYLDGGAGADWMQGEAGNDVLLGGEGADQLIGDATYLEDALHGNDYLAGEAGDDRLFGQGGNDVLWGGTGDDILVGGAGKDTYIFNRGDGKENILDTSDTDGNLAERSVLVLGDGIKRESVKFGLGSLLMDLGGGDAIHFEGFDSSDPLSTPVVGEIRFADGSVMTYADILAQGFDIDGTAESDDGHDTEHPELSGTGVTDRIRGLEGNDRLLGLAGDDILDGGAGDDQLVGGEGLDEIHAGDGYDLAWGGSGNDILYGESGIDMLQGEDGNDYLDGGEGADVLAGGAGDDIYVYDSEDTVSDGVGINQIIFQGGIAPDDLDVTQVFAEGESRLVIARRGVSALGAGMVIEGVGLGSEGFTYRFGGGTQITQAQLLSVAYRQSLNLAGGEGDDVLAGYAGDDQLSGLAGDDLLLGGAGADRLYGDTGGDTLSGGAGDDLLSGGYGADIYTFGLGDGHDIIADGGSDGATDTLQLGQGLTVGDITVTHEANGDLKVVLNATQESVIVQAWYLQQAVRVGRTEQPASRIKRIVFEDGSVLDETHLASIAIAPITGTQESDHLRGTQYNDVLQGLAGADVLDGGYGNDVLRGGSGADTYLLGWGMGRDLVIEEPGESGTIMLAPAMAFNEIAATRENNDLFLHTQRTNHGLLLKDYYLSPGDWTIQSALGETLSLSTFLLRPEPTTGDAVADLREQWKTQYKAEVFYGNTTSEILPGGVLYSAASQVYVSANVRYVDGVLDRLNAGRANASESFTQLQFTSAASDAATQFHASDWDSSMVATPVTFAVAWNTPSVSSTTYYAGTVMVANPDPDSRIDYVSKNVYGAFVSGSASGSVQAILPSGQGVSSQDFAQALLSGGSLASAVEGDLYTITTTQRVLEIHAGPSGNLILAGAGAVDGGDGNDRIYGWSDGYNFLYGGAGEDLLVGSGWDDWLLGGTGNDHLIGNSGDDLYYVLPQHAGIDVIDEVNPYLPWPDEDSNSYYINDAYAGSTDTVEFAPGIGVNDLSVIWGLAPGLSPYSRAYYDSVDIYWGTGHGVKVMMPDLSDPTVAMDMSFYPGASWGVEFFKFADGTIWTMAQMAARAQDDQAPQVAVPVADQTTQEDQPFEFQLPENTFADMDAGDTLSYDATLANGAVLPSWLTFDASSRTFSGIPANADVGTLSITVTATDTFGVAASDSFDLTVTNTNDAPTGNADTIALAGGATTANLVAVLLANDTDPDLGDTRTLSSVNAAATLGTVSFDAIAQTLTYTANAAAHDALPAGVAAVDEFTYTISDSAGATASATVSITVTGVNDAPRDIALAGNFISENAPGATVGTLSATDPDTGDTSFIFSILPGEHAGEFVLSGNTLEVGSGGLDYETGSVRTLTIRATDQGGLSTDRVFTIEVANVNEAPALAHSIAGQAATEDQEFLFVVPDTAFSDPDLGDTLTYTASLSSSSALPSWLTFDAQTRTFSGTPLNAHVGTVSVKVSATDGVNAPVSDLFDIVVANTNDAPTASGTIANQSVLEDSQFSLKFPASLFADVDAGDTLTWSATLSDGTTLPAWLSFDANTGTLTGNPSYENAGTVTVRSEATDLGGLSAWSDFGLTVNLYPDLVITGTPANDTLVGHSGNDLIDGLAGADTMAGARGNDTYVADNTGDVITELAGQGTDSVRSSVTYTLPNHVENLTLTGTSAINGAGNSLGNVLTGNSANNTLAGGAGNDVLDGGAGKDTMLGGSGDDRYIVDATTDTVTENAAEGMDTVESSVAWTLGANVENLVLTGSAGVNGNGNALANLLVGNLAKNALTGGAGHDILQGLDGNDPLSDSGGNTVFDGGAGNDSMTGNAGNELFIGGAENDAIATGTGADIIAFNLGDGKDVVNGSSGAGNTISLGGGIEYGDLSLTRSGADLVLNTGATDKLTLAGWYAGNSNKSVVNLQVIAEAMAGFNPGGTNSTLDNKIETFSFASLTSAFDAAGQVNQWSLMNALLSAHLGGSDTAAIGGDLAYQYGRTGSLAGIGLTPAQDVIGAPGFGSTAQALRPLAQLQQGEIRLS